MKCPKKREHQKFETLKEYFDFSTINFKDKVAFIEIKDKTELTFEQFRTNSICAAFSLGKLIGNKLKNCAIISENSIEYMIAYFAVSLSNNVNVMIAGDLDEETLLYQIKHTDCEVAFVSKNYIDKVCKIKEECPKLKHIILVSKEKSDTHKSLVDLIEEGNNNLNKAVDKYQSINVDPEQLCQILFTSGTSGYNKAVMLSNKNVCCSVYSALENFGRYDTTISVLPFYHAYENSCHVLPAIFCGCTNYINDSLAKLRKNIKNTPAQMTVVVPMILDTMANKIISESKRLYSEKYLKLGINTSNILRTIGIDLREKLFYPGLKMMSDTLRVFVVGGAPVNSETYDLLTSMGFTIINGYGETECAPLIACNTPEKQKRLSVGKVIDGMQIKIGPKDENGNGEILVKGNGVMLGYYKDEKANKESFDDDGWLKTGDLGFIDKRGNLFLCGRSKNLIILSNGKNIYPEELEDLLSRKLRYIDEIIVNTDKKQSGLYANIYLKEEFTRNKTDEEIYKIVKFDVAKFNKNMPSYKYIKDINIQKEPFKKNINKKIIRQSIEMKI